MIPVIEMLTPIGHFNRPWLELQTTERLRYEARCERVCDWATLQRHTLLLVLGQIHVVPVVMNSETDNSANLESKIGRGLY